MTNFTGIAPKRLQVTPAQALVGLPIAAGGLLATVLVVLWVWPQWQQLQTSRGRMAEAMTRRRQLPALRQQLAAAQEALQDEANRRAQVLGLIAGTEQLEVFLTALADVAVRQGVTISRYEPRGVVSGRTTAASTPAGSEEDDESTGDVDSLDDISANAGPGDPLLTDDLRRQQILVTLEGRYGDNVAVLRALESFRPLVIVNDFKVEGRAPQPLRSAGRPAIDALPGHGGTLPITTLPITTRMNLTLSVYGRQP